MFARFVTAVAAMVLVITASNILVLYPVDAQVGPINLKDLLTWGAFTYPFAFLVSDLTNRYDGATRARQVVIVGFLFAVAMSFYLSFNPLPWNVAGGPPTTPRVATASVTAFLIGQLLDISLFSRLRASKNWFLPPLAGSLLGSLLDTAIFFAIAFAPAVAFVDSLYGRADGSLGFDAPWLGIGSTVPLWVSLASGDFAVKFLAALLLLAPYRMLMGKLMPLGVRPVTAG